jgi:hypothetical protein
MPVIYDRTDADQSENGDRAAGESPAWIGVEIVELCPPGP